MEQLLKKWSEHLGPNKVVKVINLLSVSVVCVSVYCGILQQAIQLSRESREQSLGILMESTAQLDDGGIGTFVPIVAA